jgi:hypothetical protein
VGATVDFSDALRGGALAPDAETEPVTLMFRLDEAVGYERFAWATRPIPVRFAARVLSKR